MSYSELIRADTGCDPADAPCVEQVMRDNNDGVLDSLRASVFRREARKAYQYVLALKEAEKDPDNHCGWLGMTRRELDLLLTETLTVPRQLAGRPPAPAAACPTCLGAGHLQHDVTGEIRACPDCNAGGVVDESLRPGRRRA